MNHDGDIVELKGEGFLHLVTFARTLSNYKAVREGQSPFKYCRSATSGLSVALSTFLILRNIIGQKNNSDSVIFRSTLEIPGALKGIKSE
jgi:hypothetical protein